MKKKFGIILSISFSLALFFMAVYYSGLKTVLQAIGLTIFVIGGAYLCVHLLTDDKQ
jgi:uncharacterized membrane protein YeiH